MRAVGTHFSSLFWAEWWWQEEGGFPTCSPAVWMTFHAIVDPSSHSCSFQALRMRTQERHWSSLADNYLPMLSTPMLISFSFSFYLLPPTRGWRDKEKHGLWSNPASTPTMLFGVAVPGSWEVLGDSLAFLWLGTIQMPQSLWEEHLGQEASFSGHSHSFETPNWDLS